MRDAVSTLPYPLACSERTIALPTMPRWPATKIFAALFMMIESLEAVGFDQAVAFGGSVIGLRHLADELLQRGHRCPAEFFACLAGVAE